MKKVLTLVIRKSASKIFGKITLKPLLFRPLDDQTDTNFLAPLRMHFKTFKSTLDSIKKCFQCI